MSLIPIFFVNRQGNNFDSFSVDVWDPFKNFPSLSQENSDFVNARVNWKETPEAHVFTIYYLDMTKEEVKVEIEDNRVLHIRGERNVEKDKNDIRLLLKRRSGKFSRRFSFKEKVKMDQVKASMENGDLTVTVPKVEVDSFSVDVWSNRQGNNFDSFSVDLWDPFENFPSLSQENSDFVYARVDWKETPEAHVFTIYYLDMTKEEVKVEIEDNTVLHISGERNVEKDKNDIRLLMKRRSGKFSRRFSFMKKVKMDQVKASMENGDLTVTVPKVEVEKPNFKTIHHSNV